MKRQSVSGWPRDVALLFGVLVAAESVLVALHLIDAFLGPFVILEALFDLNQEASVPAWFSAMQLFAVAALFLLMARFAVPNCTRRPSRAGLATVGLAFLFLSMDEAAVVHEGFGEFVRDVAWLPRFSGEAGLWIVPYALVGLLIIGLLWPDVRRSWRHYRRPSRLVAVGGALLVLGGVGMEIVGYEWAREMGPLYHDVEIAVEEFLEMFGVTVILVGSIGLAMDVLGPHVSGSDPAEAMR